MNSKDTETPAVGSHMGSHGTCYDPLMPNPYLLNGGVSVHNWFAELEPRTGYRSVRAGVPVGSSAVPTAEVVLV